MAIQSHVILFYGRLSLTEARALVSTGCNGSQDSLDIVESQGLDTQKLVVDVVVCRTIALAEHRDEDISEHDAFRVITLGKLGVRVVEHILGAHVLGLLGLAGDLLHELHELVLRDGDGLGEHGLVLGLLGVGQDTDDGLADGGHGGGTPELVSAVEDAGLAGLRVDQGVHLQAGFEEATGADEGV
jgi:hypothetical protein